LFTILLNQFPLPPLQLDLLRLPFTALLLDDVLPVAEAALLFEVRFSRGPDHLGRIDDDRQRLGLRQTLRSLDVLGLQAHAEVAKDVGRRGLNQQSRLPAREERGRIVPSAFLLISDKERIIIVLMQSVRRQLSGRGRMVHSRRASRKRGRSNALARPRAHAGVAQAQPAREPLRSGPALCGGWVTLLAPYPTVTPGPTGFTGVT